MSPVPIHSVQAEAYGFPTPAPRSDGTLDWDRTELVTVAVHAGGLEGFGYTYSTRAAAVFIHEVLAASLNGLDAMAIGSCRDRMRRCVRNFGAGGIAAAAISAVDIALWDLKGKLLDRPVADLLGRHHGSVDAYASGGFCSQTESELLDDVVAWCRNGVRRLKIKVGRQDAMDRRRVSAVRSAVGPGVGLMVDANGAYDRHRAKLAVAAFADADIEWLEEPVSSDDIEGLAAVRRIAPPTMALAAGEYIWRPEDARVLLNAEAIDVLQLDATRCGGISGFLACAGLTEGLSLSVSSHCAPALHARFCGSLTRFMHAEYFCDHAAIEQRVLEGCPSLRQGMLVSDLDRPGIGLELRRADAADYVL